MREVRTEGLLLLVAMLTSCKVSLDLYATIAFLPIESSLTLVFRVDAEFCQVRRTA